MMGILEERIAEVRQRLGTATLVAVTKSVGVETARRASELGIADLAENRPQQLWEKQAAIPARWHLIGHLQRNKIKRTVPLCTLIHSVDSLRLLAALDAFGRKTQPVSVLLQVNCSREPQKGGFAVEEIPAIADLIPTLPGVNLQGLMTMAAEQGDPRPTFAELRSLRDDLQTRTGLVLPHLSMGMSGDYEIAIEEGATLVRLGSALFEGLS